MWSTPLQIRVSRLTDNSNAAQLTYLTAVEGQYRISTASFLTGTHLGFYGIAEHPCPKLSNFSCPASGVAPWATRTDPTRISLFCLFFFAVYQRSPMVSVNNRVFWFATKDQVGAAALLLRWQTRQNSIFLPSHRSILSHLLIDSRRYS